MVHYFHASERKPCGTEIRRGSATTRHAVRAAIQRWQASPETPHGLTLCEYICKIWTSEPERFIFSPSHQTHAGCRCRSLH
ncbi:hypothetical protein GOB85_13945 [Acetobacter sp. LMG 1636]|nr:hypothetical protein [Acetobacter fallax]